MSQVSSLGCELPFCPSTEREQTSLSVGLRITACALGTLAVVAGILVLWGIPGLSSLGNVAGWTTLSAGAALALAGTFIGCFKRESDETVSTPEPAAAIPSYLTINLPAWLKLDNIPFLRLPEPFTNVDQLKHQCTAPVTFYFHDFQRGLCMQVRVEHLYSGFPSNRAPFTMWIVIANNFYTDTKWVLHPERRQVKDATGLFNTAYVFGGDEYFTNDHDYDVTPLIPIAFQGSLPENQRNHVGWIAARLLQQGDTLLYDLLAGWWKVSLVR